MASHLDDGQRWLIDGMLRTGSGIPLIARETGKHRSTVYREIRRGMVEQKDGRRRKIMAYRADYAILGHASAARRKGRPEKIGGDHASAARLERLIVDGRYSPYAALELLSRELGGVKPFSVTTLYRYIDTGMFRTLDRSHLPYNVRPRKAKPPPPRPSRRLGGAKTIDDRPAAADDRSIPGHWECDTIVSGKGPGGRHKSPACLLVLTERSSRRELIRKLPDMKAATVVGAFDALEFEMGRLQFKAAFRTVTFDNGPEFSDWRGLERSVFGGGRTLVYFCHPSRPSERASNEKNNTLIRRWIPKGSDITAYDDDYVAMVRDWMNGCPRRKFGGLSADEYAASLESGFT